ncbi:MAG: acyltransferase family protein, partial [Nitratireductor sp.]
MQNTAAHTPDLLHTSQNGTAKRVDWVDYAKGLCIILVVMMHSTLGVEKAAGATGWLGTFVEFARPFRMPDFFLISGLFLALVINRNWLRYFDRKVVHFFYFYILWVTIQFAFKAPVWLGEGASIGELALKYANVFIEPFGTLWFIYILPIFFIVTRLLKSLPWWALFAGAALLQILPIHTGYLLVDEFSSRYVFFLAGYLFANKIFDIADWLKANKATALIFMALWAVINGTIVFAPVPEFINQTMAVKSLADLPLVSLCLGGLGAFAIIVASTLLSSLSFAGFLEYLGKHSI